MTKRQYPRHVWRPIELTCAGELKRNGLGYAEIPAKLGLAVTAKAVKRALQKNQWAL